MARRKARELAFRTLFQAERGGGDLTEVWEQVRADLAIDLSDSEEIEAAETYGDALDAEGVRFADRLIRTFARHQSDIDKELGEAIEGWSFGQMAQTDLNVLRLALTELHFEASVPAEVTIEIAIRIAKKYGGEESGRFVNGVLAKLVRDHAVAAEAKSPTEV